MSTQRATSLRAVDEEYEIIDLDTDDVSDFDIESLSEDCPDTTSSRKCSSTPAVSHPDINLSESFVEASIDNWSHTKPVIWEDYQNGTADVRYEGGDGLYNLAGLMDRRDTVNYELCGRRSENAFRDLRSAARSRKRRRREQNKYYNWKEVKPAWLGARVHKICELSSYGCLCRDTPSRDNDELITVTKQMMFEVAKGYPRPPTYHSSTRKSHLHLGHAWARIEREQQQSKHAHHRLEDECSDWSYIDDVDENVWRLFEYENTEYLWE